jgi:Zn-dependent peptidase ImmA (M78 family)
VRDEIPQKNEEGLFVDRCQRYGFLERITGASAPRPLPSYELDIVATSYEQVGTWAEWVRNELGLGELPAPALRETLENVAGVKVFLAALSGGSGAATRGDFGPAILVNGAESVERQAYSLAHELFHLLTWSAMPPEGEALSVEYERRNEQLANVFASNLLLPAERLLQRLGPGTLEGRRVIELEGLAREFGVSLPALLYRLVNLGRLDRDTASRLIEDPTRGRARLPEENRRVCGLPGRYVTLAFQAYVDGLISTGKLAYLLETSIGQLPEVLAEHGFDLDTDAYQAKVLSA